MRPRPPEISSLACLIQGRRIGPYVVSREIGRGGMAAVFEAHHEQLGPAARAAIKLLAPDLAGDPEASARFFNEARAASLISHPGVVRIIDFGRLPPPHAEIAYILMEYLEGDSLWRRFHDAHHCDYGWWPGVVRQIAAAMAVVHEQGIVHRDLKPMNVVLVADPEVPCGERIKVVDFGIAKLRPEHYHPDNTVVQTSAGALLGTPLYMSPEQCARVEAVDGKADVYSLGSMLYQFLSGCPLFPDRDTAALLVKQMRADPIPLRRRAPSVPPDLALLVHAMLEKLPSRRPSMDQVVERLAPFAETTVPGDSQRTRRKDPAGMKTLQRGEREPLWRRLLGSLLGPFARSKA